MSQSFRQSLSILTVMTLLAVPAAAAELQLQKGDHISYVGNTLADRMQHDGWLETLIQNRFPKDELVFRNLGFSADEIDKRPREANFGSPDQWLTRTQTSIVFAFFGYNESFAGAAGVDSFKAKLASFIDSTLKQNYNGKATARLVVFSPIAHENLHNPNLPDGSENNARLALYTNAMSEVCAEKNVPFVDLFSPSLQLYESTAEPLTINGVHLNPLGNRKIAEVIDAALFGAPAPHDPARLAKINEAVREKNFHWFNLYRTIDGYNVFGGRSKLSWHGQSNADVMQREMDIFEVMTANRDKRIHAVAQGGDLKVDDSNAPPLLEVKTNKPGPLEGGKYPFLGGEEAIEKMTVAAGMEINLFASEEQFPELINPVQTAVDTDGRLWVATWPTYPHWNPKEELRDKLVILPDENGDGKADELIVFADQLNSITGFEFWGGGVLVAAAPEIWFLKDTDGDDKADVKVRMLQGVSSADSHHTANALTIGPDGCLYWSRGIFNVCNMETPTGTFRSSASGVYRFDPRTFEINFHFPIGPNPHGDVFDQWGYQFANDGTSGTGSYVSIGKGVGAPKQWFQKRVRPVPATGILSSSHFPPENNGNFLICNAIGFLGVLQHRVEYDGADINAIEIEPIVYSSDQNFRPTDLEIGGDGALYISDWCNPLIGHMQHNIRDPNRDHLHGRIYRVTAKGRDLLKPVKMKGKPIEEVLTHVYAKENGTRYRVRIELSGRDTQDVVAALEKFAATIEPKSPEDEQALLELLWIYAEHRVPNEALLKKVFQAKEPRVRAAAIRTLGLWGDKVQDWEPLLVAAARDREPLVRAEAVKAAVSFEGLGAAEAIFEAAIRPTDVQLDFVLNYARGKINVDAIVQEALASGKKLSPAANAYALRNASVEDLLKMDKTEAVYTAILSRSNVAAEDLQGALSGLAKLKNTSEIRLLIELIREADANEQSENLDSYTRLLSKLPAGQLKEVRDQMKALAMRAKSEDVRRLGYAGWISADESADGAFDYAIESKDRLREVLNAISLVADEKVRAGLFAKVQPLLFELPPHLTAEGSDGAFHASGIQVDYYHPSPSNVARETLEKLEPKDSGIVPEIVMNVPQRKAADAFALRFTGAIHLETTGKYTFFTNSDDGSRLYIGDTQVVDNDGLHGMVEKSGSIELRAGSHPITVTYFDNGGGDGLEVSYSGPGIQKQKIPAARLSVSGGGDTIHDLAIQSLEWIPGHDAAKLANLAALIKAGRNRTSAIQAMRKIDSQHWPAPQARAVVDNLIAYVSNIPAKYRTGTAAVDAMALTRELAKKLPADQAKAVEHRLANLDVRVIAIGTVPHRMIYDKEVIAVQAGKPVEFRFSNTDNMPHNFSITLPGAMEEVGLLAEATGRDPDAMERNYIPVTDKILLASKLLNTGESQSLSFEVPSEPGVYPYVCTYPGHWMRMYGALYVVDDLDAYQDDSAAYLAKVSLPIQDALLANQRNHEWKFDEFAEDIEMFGHGQRSFEVGKQVFKVAACQACHRLDGEGIQVGPELAKLDEKKKNVEHILRSIVEPSKEIEPKFRSYLFALDSGQVMTAMVLEETGDAYTVVENPLAKSKPVVISKDEIVDKKESPKSIMPEGLLNKLTREEILDLAAFVLSGGNKDHEMYQDHQHKH